MPTHVTASSPPPVTASTVPDAHLGGPFVLVVGDSSEARALERRLARDPMPTVFAASTDEADGAVTAGDISVVVIDIDVEHDAAVGFCRRLKQDSATRLIPILQLSDDREREHRLAGIEAGAEAFLTKPFDPQELLARVRACSRLTQYTNDLDSATSIVMTVTAMIEARECSPGHCFRMANYATALGRAMRLNDADLKALYRGGFLHDIGMLAIPDHILRKDGRLDPEEYAVVKSHPVVGDTLCKNLRTLHSVRPIVRHHHERLDGSGYPDGLRGDDVPLIAQIVSVVDVFEAITMGREYVAPRAATEAIEVLRHEAHVGWRRPDVVDQFASLVESGALETFRGGGAAGSSDEVERLTSDLQRATAGIPFSPTTSEFGPWAA